MILSGLVDFVGSEPVLAEAIADCRSGRLAALDLTLPEAVRPVFVAALSAQAKRPVLLITSTFREAEAAVTALTSLLGADKVAYYPAWETLPHERLSPRSDTVGRRLALLRRLAGNDPEPPPSVIVAPVRAVLQPQVKGLAELLPVQLVTGCDYDIDEVAQGLVDAAYVRVDLVERRGEFCVRGGLIDVFPPTEEHPVRVDFFGDTVEEIRPFSVADQRSGEATLDAVIASPCRELLLTDQVRARAAALATTHHNEPGNLAEMFERIAAGHAVDGMESLAPVLTDGLELLIDVMAANAQILLSDPERIRSRAHELVATSEEFLNASWAAAAEGGKAPIDLGAAAYQSLADVRAHALELGQSWWSLSAFAAAEDDQIEVRAADLSTVRSRLVPASEAPVWRGDTEAALAAIKEAVRAGHHAVLVAESAGLAERMAEVLAAADIPVAKPTELIQAPKANLVTVVRGGLRHGFSLPAIGLDVFTAADLSGQRDRDPSATKMPARRKNQIDPLELSPGDAVVHEVNGVGRYVEMVQRTVQGATREYLVLDYAPSKRGQPGDRLYVPMDQLHLVTRYVGGESPTLDKLGGGDWAKRKSRARKAVREIAAELIKLYAARKASRGHAFSADTVWQGELEDAFAYVETPDQLSAVGEVKQDMEQIVPMDRLICGDVGYGKTEIAVRAAFKAVMDGKQVAVLVPTTLLVQQHQATFADRYAGFPVTVASLSRFQSDAEKKKIIEGLAAGGVDVVVGTHSLISSAVEFKDLGLVIIDEEQRFGVEHKEALKKLRLNVDVLAMSATPIPRTLEMAITGIREMSVIATPPEERHPVLTFAGPYDTNQVRAAIRRELAREGQAFYIHNRVQSIEKTAQVIAELVPEARVAVAHGQMNEHALEQVMIDFWERRSDVLVCTTIVEAGLDISTANTLLIERADLLGLGQLHQLRGRVGRGRDRGYAYFLYPPEKPLTETAHDRLATMAAHTDLGAGMAIAMKDLEIRGAGNLLGGQQSGHIAEVGFDLYIRLVGEAVAEFRGEEAEPEPEMKIELPVDAHLPPDYVESERLRLEMYKRLAAVSAEADITAVREELLDRYGPLPAPAEALLSVASFRLEARRRGVHEIVMAGAMVRFAPVDLPDSAEMRVARLYPGSQLRKAAGHLLVPRPMTRPITGQPIVDSELLEWARKLLSDIFTVAPVRAGGES
ncbi:transcription-repair coupling factor [Propionicimonas sp.]|uniref:transcription-repair coupling factor n=1 Tax=Propionicimonas sp. TaxID=1955623 RepID=UPI00179D3998|nr:transcription-repair coupling factor [Propionicimonas sp.]MBU3976474.1 transcription-repair coupling factor [Actinomycetota bacterium]MBA3020314.1 transcription-repair coupling factor [Propionicimonas sp.]MBU3987306.1 transcription-repair coupling factor [Actinomycetota bacterium]MBU4007618.1 transcription-repair coupling factor [Actinomycetota bacterium]MBU4064399.1 transcription-repair coupling factor [Actinomycetota bacterium]